MKTLEELVAIGAIEDHTRREQELATWIRKRVEFVSAVSEIDQQLLLTQQPDQRITIRTKEDGNLLNTLLATLALREDLVRKRDRGLRLVGDEPTGAEIKGVGQVLVWETTFEMVVLRQDPTSP